MSGRLTAIDIIEVACRYIVADRCGASGTRWLVDGTDAIRNLLIIRSNGDYRRISLSREHE